MSETHSGCGGRLQIVRGDITECAVDAIVNAANTSLLGGAGVDGAIHDAAGPELLDECRTLGGCPTGSARITRGYALPARHVIHTVGPIWYGGTNGEDELLASCYRSCFALAEQHGLRTLAFPSISTGAYRFPVQRAARIALNEIAQGLERLQTIASVIVVCFEGRVYDAYHDALNANAP
ncbi:MAG: O-acetyl-ADP-ribose deacetylase [Planctomycetia bacterium]|nr:O-acetyl-ADP-ribose deacetylase [Planctomycetia bacterium]